MGKPRLVVHSWNRKWNGCLVSAEFLNTKRFLWSHYYPRGDYVTMLLTIKQLDNKIKPDTLTIHEAISENGLIAEELLIKEIEVEDRPGQSYGTTIECSRIPDSAYCIIYNMRGKFVDKFNRELAILGKEAK